jgi:hypothetical protein
MFNRFLKQIKKLILGKIKKCGESIRNNIRRRLHYRH